MREFQGGLFSACLECEGEGAPGCWMCDGEGMIPVDSEFDADVRMSLTAEFRPGAGFVVVESSAEMIGEECELTAEDDEDEPWRE